jgi:hypothetical protein
MPNRSHQLQSVTKRDDESRNVSQASHAVTARHAASHRQTTEPAKQKARALDQSGGPGSETERDD